MHAARTYYARQRRSFALSVGFKGKAKSTFYWTLYFCIFFDDYVCLLVLFLHNDDITRRHPWITSIPCPIFTVSIKLRTVESPAKYNSRIISTQINIEPGQSSFLNSRGDAYRSDAFCNDIIIFAEVYAQLPSILGAISVGNLPYKPRNCQDRLK